MKGDKMSTEKEIDNLKMRVITDITDTQVKMEFDKMISWLIMTPEKARELATMLVKVAELIEKREARK
jgi:hypothetical protein